MGLFQLKKIEGERLFIGKFPNHTQAVERAVKVVSHASGKVVGQERRDGLVHNIFHSRSTHSKTENKKDLAKLIAPPDSDEED